MESSCIMAPILERNRVEGCAAGGFEELPEKLYMVSTWKQRRERGHLLKIIRQFIYCVFHWIRKDALLKNKQIWAPTGKSMGTSSGHCFMGLIGSYLKGSVEPWGIGKIEAWITNTTQHTSLDFLLSVTKGLCGLSVFIHRLQVQCQISALFSVSQSRSCMD